jgi:hypothetical protein
MIMPRINSQVTEEHHSGVRLGYVAEIDPTCYRKSQSETDPWIVVYWNDGGSTAGVLTTLMKTGLRFSD